MTKIGGQLNQQFIDQSAAKSGMSDQLKTSVKSNTIQTPRSSDISVKSDQNAYAVRTGYDASRMIRYQLEQTDFKPAPPYPPKDEYGYVLNSIAERYGQQTAENFAEIPHGQWQITHTTPPQIGEIMVWQADGGSDIPGNFFGKANEEGHVGIIVDITPNGEGNLTLKVAEQGWNTSNGQLEDGAPFRLIDVTVGDDGKIELPDGVGFLDPSQVSFPETAPTETQPTEVPTFETAAPYNTAAGNLPYSAQDEYGFVLNYLSATHGEQAAAMADVAHGNWQFNSTHLPQNGEVMVWQSDKGNADVGYANSVGHVAVVIDVKNNGNDTATITLAEQNWTYDEKDKHGMLDDNRTPYRQITVPLNDDGTPVLPDGVGFITNDADLAALSVDPNDPYAGLSPTITGLNSPSSFNTPVETGEVTPEIPNYEYSGCVRYITDKLGIGYTLSQGRTDSVGNTTTMGFDFDRQQIAPQAGMIMSWAAKVPENPYTGGSYDQGHVAYVDNVTVRESSNGKLFFEVSLIEGNDAKSADKVYRRTLLIPVQYGADGNPLQDASGNYLPDVNPAEVGFSQP